MRLDVRVSGLKKLFRAFYGEILYHVDILTATVITMPWIAFRVFRGEDGGLGLSNIDGWVILRGDEFNALILPFGFFIKILLDDSILHVVYSVSYIG